MTSALFGLLAPERLTHVVDVGAKAGHGQPPYAPLIAEGLCHVTGFEPQQHALADLLSKCGPNENYLPYAIGDGGEHTLNLCRSDGMTSLLTPIPQNLGLLGNLGWCAEIIERVPVQTQRLDDIAEIEHLDFLKIDIHGGELAVFQNGRGTLAECVAIQTEVSFAPGYENQPSLGDIDVELRSQGFIPHCFAEIHKQPIAPVRRSFNQVFDADLVYVRDFCRPEAMSDEQLKHLALVAHYCYRSFDLALRCVGLLEERNAVETGTLRRYVEAPVGAH